MSCRLSGLMSATIAHPPAPINDLAYLARVTTRDHRAIEEALAGATLLTESPNLAGVVIEAAYAAGDPPLLKRLREDGIARVVDPQSLRLTGSRFLEVDALTSLPYAPKSPLSVSDLPASRTRALARRTLEFEQRVGCDMYVAPGLPLYDTDLDAWLAANDAILDAACSANGGAELDRKPLLALVAPGAKAMARPDDVVRHLLDYPIDGVYLQALRLDPVRDSLEKLARFVQFAHAIQSLGVPVIVGRVGAFGLVLQALGVTAFDSGLGLAEAHDLATLNRSMTEREHQRRAEGEGGGGPAQRVYLELLKTTFDAKIANVILADNNIRHRFTCNRSCCRFRGFDDISLRARQHYLWTRQAEVEALRKLTLPAMRITHVESQLRAAKDTAIVVGRILKQQGVTPPEFEHLGRWLGLIAREQQLALTG
jgi:hypothetical protein